MAYIKNLKIGSSTASLRIEGEGIVHENVGIRIYFIIYSNIKINGTILLVPTTDVDKDFKYEVAKVEVNLNSFAYMDVLDVSLINYVTTLLATLNDLDWLSIVKCVFIVYPEKLHYKHDFNRMHIQDYATILSPPGRLNPIGYEGSRGILDSLRSFELYIRTVRRNGED